MAGTPGAVAQEMVALKIMLLFSIFKAGKFLSHSATCCASVEGIELQNSCVSFQVGSKNALPGAALSGEAEIMTFQLRIKAALELDSLGSHLPPTLPSGGTYPVSPASVLLFEN